MTAHSFETGVFFEHLGIFYIRQVGLQHGHVIDNHGDFRTTADNFLVVPFSGRLQSTFFRRDNVIY